MYRNNEHKVTPGCEAEIDSDQPAIYEIRIRGHLGCQWGEWFGGVVVSPEDDGVTLLTGRVVDQAALHGLLKKVRDLGIPLISVNRLTPGQAERPQSKQDRR